MEEEIRDEDGDNTEISELRKEHNDLKLMMATPGWQRFCAFGWGQVENRMGTVLSPLEDTAKLASQEYMKGEIGGISLLLKFVVGRIESLNEDINRIIDTLDQESEDGHSNSSGAGDGVPNPDDNPFGDIASSFRRG